MLEATDSTFTDQKLRKPTRTIFRIEVCLLKLEHHRNAVLGFRRERNVERRPCLRGVRIWILTIDLQIPSLRTGRAL